MPAPLPEPKSDIDRRVLDNIARVGWSVMGVAPDDEGPGFSYSIGLYHTFGQPELLIMGLGVRNELALINAVGHRMRPGERFTNGQRCVELANNPTARGGGSATRP